MSDFRKEVVFLVPKSTLNQLYIGFKTFGTLFLGPTFFDQVVFVSFGNTFFFVSFRDTFFCKFWNHIIFDNKSESASHLHRRRFSRCAHVMSHILCSAGKINRHYLTHKYKGNIFAE